MRPASPKSRRSQRGAVIVWIALFMMVMLMFIALGIDVAKLMVTRSQLQNAADAAALAGASAIDAATAQFVEEGPDGVRARAAATASSNRAYERISTPVVINPQGDVFIDQANRTVTVVTHRDDTNGQPMIVHFAQVLGIHSLQTRATATAKVDFANSVCMGLVPLAMAPMDSDQVFVPGCNRTYQLKYGGGAGSQGWYGAIRFDQCPEGDCGGMNPSGASTYRCLLANGYGCCVDISDCLRVETGNMAGPTLQGLRSRFLLDTDQREGDICYSEVSPSGQAPYHGSGQRVIYVPITDRPTGGGGGCVRVKSFAAFFLKQLPGVGTQSFIFAEFIDKVVPGTGEGPPSSTLFALRLVR